MSRNGKKYKDSDFRYKLTEEEKRVRADEKKQKEEAVRKQAEKDASTISERHDGLIKEAASTSTTDFNQTIVLFNKLVEFQAGIQAIHPTNLEKETAEKLAGQNRKIGALILLVKKGFKDKLHEKMDRALDAKDLKLYDGTLMPFARRAVEAGMMTWEESIYKVNDFAAISEDKHEARSEARRKGAVAVATIH